MISKLVYELNEQDLIKILAEKFKTKSTNITIKIKKTCVGYGEDEHYENKVVVIVEAIDYI